MGLIIITIIIFIFFYMHILTSKDLCLYGIGNLGAGVGCWSINALYSPRGRKSLFNASREEGIPLTAYRYSVVFNLF